MLKYIFVLYVLLITTLEVMANHDVRPWEGVAKWVPWHDKVGHFLVMGSLAWLVNLLLSGATWRILSRSVLVGSLLVLALSTVLEISQAAFPARTFSFGDLASDVAGILCIGSLPIRRGGWAWLAGFRIPACRDT